MESAIVPGIYDPSLADEDLRVEHRARATGWCAGSRAKKGCWSASRRARRSRRRSTSRSGSTQRRRRHGVSGRRREVSDRDASGRPMTDAQRDALDAGVDAGDSAARRGDVSARMLRRARRPRRSRDGDVVPLPNTTEEGPRRRFLVRPSDYRLAEQRATRARRRAARVLSLASGSSGAAVAVRSRSRVADFAYVIVAVAAGAAGDMTVWCLKDDRSSFEEGELHHGDENSDSDTAQAVHR